MGKMFKFIVGFFQFYTHKSLLTDKLSASYVSKIDVDSKYYTITSHPIKLCSKYVIS